MRIILFAVGLEVETSPRRLSLWGSSLRAERAGFEPLRRFARAGSGMRACPRAAEVVGVVLEHAPAVRHTLFRRMAEEKCASTLVIGFGKLGTAFDQLGGQLDRLVRRVAWRSAC